MKYQEFNRLHKSIADLAGLERTIEQSFKTLADMASGFPELARELSEIQERAAGHGNTLMTRLETLVGDTEIPARTFALNDAGEDQQYPLTTAFQRAFALLNQALIEYTTLQVISSRSRDSWVVADSGTTGHIARENVEQYTSAIQKIHRLIHHAVVLELEQEGTECQCSCPSCSLGICLCAAASRYLLNDAWSEAGTIDVYGGHFVVKPRTDSAASDGGLRRGDVVVAVDGQDIQKYSDVQAGVAAHKSGEPIKLTIQRADVSEEITVVHP